VPAPSASTESLPIGAGLPPIVHPGTIHRNLPVARLAEHAVTRGEALLTDTGAILADTTPRTGRSPNDKYLVEESASRDSIDWGKVNRPMPAERFDALLRRVTANLQGRDLFVCDANAGADPRHRLPIRVIAEYAWHSLFARQLFRRPTEAELAADAPAFTVIAAPGFRTDPAVDGTNSEACIALSLEKRIVLIVGTRYAGEIKKSIFTVMNHLLPDQGVFPMHCSANLGRDGDVALFFGLSGTGKTTLSADPARRLIGDDEHGWSNGGVFNFEGGCYAKCIRLSPEREPQIYSAIRFGSVLENVVIDPVTRTPNYDSDAITENTRVAYPLEFIDNAVTEGFVARHPRAVIFLTCDAFGILPPMARLTPSQAMYYFLSGYTAKLAGTEAGMGSTPQVTFSACFGAPFLTRRPMVYADMLAERLKKHDARCFLINTGWSGGAFGEGQRIRLPHTRAMIDAVLSGAISENDCRPDPIFGLAVPRQCPGVDPQVLDARSAWKNPAQYDAKAKELAARFAQNFKSFAGLTRDVIEAGPRAG